MRRAAVLTCGLLLVSACQAEGAPEPTEPAAPIERSPEENEPVELAPSVELTGASAAALHRRALREADPARAAEMFERACDSSFTPACIAFADVLEAGDGLSPDPERARVVLEQACLDGSTIACDRLGH